MERVKKTDQTVWTMIPLDKGEWWSIRQERMKTMTASQLKRWLAG
jgi:hypothetical protein